MENKTLLKVSQLGMTFGGLKAVQDVNFQINHGDLIGLIGPNGAGKTTLFNMLTGVYKPTTGTVELGGQKISGLPTHTISQLGLARTFQNIRLFKGLSVLENILISAHKNVHYNYFDFLFLNNKFKNTESQLKSEAIELLKLFHLEDKLNEEAGSLPYGEQRKLEIVRALMTHPKMILLDEPAAGMNHQETHELMELIAFIRKKFNLTVMLIEHDMKLVMGICEKIIVLDHGIKIAEGNPEQIKTSKAVIEAYLGVDEVEHA